MLVRYGTGAIMPAGRPSKYDPKYCDELIEYFTKARSKLDWATGTRGLLFPTLQGFAANIGVHLETLTNWARANPEFFEARKRAEAIQHALLVEGALADVFPGAPAIFAMKNLMKWRDKADINVGGQDDEGQPVKTIAVEKLTKDEREQALGLASKALQNGGD